MYEKRKSVVQASLDFLFYARRTSNSHHERYSYSLLGPGTLTAHRRFHLVLLHSCPDTVHGVLLRKTQTSTSLIEGSFAMKEPSDWHHPRCSGLRVQGTAISPAVRKLYDLVFCFLSQSSIHGRGFFVKQIEVSLSDTISYTFQTGSCILPHFRVWDRRYVPTLP